MAIGKKIGELLLAKGYMTGEKIAEAARISSEEGIRFGEACLRAGFIEEYQLTEVLAEQYGLEVIDIAHLEIDEETLELIPADVLRRARLLPVRNRGFSLIVTADPTEILTIDEVERLMRETKKNPGRLAVVPDSFVEKALNRNSQSARAIMEAARGFDASGQDEEDTVALEHAASDASPVVKIVDSVISEAISMRASDIHLESGENGMTVKYRIDGVLHKIKAQIDKRLQASVISRVKVMSELDISERRIPQDGRFKVKIRGKAIDFRVSIMPSVHEEDAVIRILDTEHISREFEDLSLEGLGFGERELAHLRRMIREPYGMVMVTGPTGSGKTTTLYAALSEINTGEDKIITIEDPVEYQLKGITQIAVNEKKGLTFVKGLRSILRHDPDKIMVGEIRDAETAQIAIQAALTGHLVFTTVHANNVFDVIGRFVHMGIEPYNFVSSLNCILAQRLIRLICRECRVQVRYEDERLIESGLDPKKYSDAVFYEGAGCGECHNTGYRGRKAIMELLDLSDDIRDMIALKQPISVIKKRAIDEGMKTLRAVAVESVLAGETTFREINRVTFVE